MGEPYQTRPIEPRDEPAIRSVLQQTMVLGQPLPFPVQDLDLLLDYFLGFYLACEPEAGLVVVDPSDRVVGYLLGTTQPTAQSRWQRREALRLAWRWLTHWRRYDAFTRYFYRLRLRDARETIVNPDPPLPAHYHWHLLPEVRGHFGRILARSFATYCRDRGVTGFGGEYPLLEGRKDEALFRRTGAQVVHRAPHHTLTGLLGTPVTRLTLYVRTADANW